MFDFLEELLCIFGGWEAGVSNALLGTRFGGIVDYLSINLVGSILKFSLIASYWEALEGH